MTKKPNPPNTNSSKETELSDEARHRFLGYLIPQLEPMRHSCEYNWLIQAVLITVAMFNLYKPDLVTGIADAVKVPVASLNLVVPVVLTYLFIRFGYLLNAYFFIRQGITEMLKAFKLRPPEFEEAEAERMLRANSLVELLYLDFDFTAVKEIKKLPFKDLKKLPSKATLPILGFMLTLVFALNHVLVLLYLGRLVGHKRFWSLLIGSIIMAIVGLCYLQFIEKTKRKGAKVVSIGAMLLIVPLFVLVHRTAYGSFW